LEISGGWCGAVHADSSPKSTLAASIASTVTAIDGCSDGTPAPVHRRRAANMSCSKNRSVGCCIHMSITIPAPFQQTRDRGPSKAQRRPQNPRGKMRRTVLGVPLLNGLPMRGLRAGSSSRGGLYI
jgi:hypothetical protein